MVDKNDTKRKATPVYDSLGLLSSPQPTIHHLPKNISNHDEFSDSDLLPVGEIGSLTLGDTMQPEYGIVEFPMDLPQVGINMRRTPALTGNEMFVTSLKNLEVNSSAVSPLQDRDEQFEVLDRTWHIPLLTEQYDRHKFVTMDGLEFRNAFAQPNSAESEVVNVDDLIEAYSFVETRIPADILNDRIGRLVQEGDCNLNRQTHLGHPEPSTLLQDDYFMADLPVFDVNPESTAWDPTSDAVKNISWFTNVESNISISSATGIESQQRSDDFIRLMHQLGLSNIVDPVPEPDTSDKEGITLSHPSKAPRQNPGELVLVFSTIKRFPSDQCHSHS